MPIYWTRCFFCILAAKSSVLVRLKTIHSVIESLAVLSVLCKRVSFGELRVSLQNNDISSSTFFICSIFPSIDGIWPDKKRIRISVLVVDKVSYFVFEIEILLKTIKGLYRISLVTRHTDCIFRELIPCCQAFCIKEMKSALSRLYIVNRVVTFCSFTLKNQIY